MAVEIEAPVFKVFGFSPLSNSNHAKGLNMGFF
jgi:hypothetical protein